MSPTCITLQEEGRVKELQTAKADRKVSEKFNAKSTPRFSELTSQLKDERVKTAQLHAKVKRASSMSCTRLPLVLVGRHT